MYLLRRWGYIGVIDGVNKPNYSNPMEGMGKNEDHNLVKGRAEHRYWRVAFQRLPLCLSFWVMVTP